MRCAQPWQWRRSGGGDGSQAWEAGFPGDCRELAVWEGGLVLVSDVGLVLVAGIGLPHVASVSVGSGVVDGPGRGARASQHKQRVLTEKFHAPEAIGHTPSTKRRLVVVTFFGPDQDELAPCSSYGTRGNPWESRFRAVQSYNDPTDGCGSGSDR